MLTIRDPRAAALAKQLALARKTTMTRVIVSALESELARDREETPLPRRLRQLAAKARAMAGPNGRLLTKDDIDALSGQ